MKITSTDRSAIRAVIEQQLFALLHDDAETAFSFASAEIQSKFITPENFLHMVKLAYPAIHRPRAVLFESLAISEVPMQEVFLLAPDGNLVKAIYLMHKQTDGVWRIDGCFLESNEDLDLAM